MIRIHAGRAWRENPRLLSELRAAKGDCPILDAVGIEVDGVDLAAGIEEDSVLAVTAELASAVAGLTAGRERASVTFRAAGVDLLLERRGASVHLSFVKLRRPAGMVLRGVEVELPALRRAALDSGHSLLAELAALNPVLTKSGPARRLAGAVRKLQAAWGPGDGISGPAGGEDAAEPRRGRARAFPASLGRRARAAVGIEGPAGARGSPACRIELPSGGEALLTFRGGPPDLQSLLVAGQVTVSLARGAPPRVADGYVFLILRELIAGGHALLRALSAGEKEHALALPGGALHLSLAAGVGRLPGVEEPLPVDPVALAGALFDAAARFTRYVVAHNPRQRENGYLAELLRGAQEGLARCDEIGRTVRGRPRRPTPSAASPGGASRGPRGMRAQAPLSTGRLCRVAFERLWSVNVLPPRGICVTTNAVVVLGEQGSAAFSPRDGRPLWTGPRGPGFALALPGGDVLVAGGRKVVRFRQARVVWSSGPLGSGAPIASLTLGADGRSAVAASANEVVGLTLAAGEPSWRFAPPGCGGLAITQAPGLTLAAASDGRLYALDPVDGHLVWRARLSGRVRGAPALWGGTAAVFVHRPEGLLLALVDLDSGEVTPLSPGLSRAGGLCAAGDALAASGTAEGKGQVVLYGRAGEVRWRSDRLLGASAPQMCAVADGVVILGARAALRVDAAGAVGWERVFEAEASGGPPPLVRRGVLLLVADDRVLALDPKTGRQLGVAGRNEPFSPRFLVADGRLSLYGAEEEGPLEAYGLRTVLSVVD